LIAIERGNDTLDIFDASLARLSSIELPLTTVRGLAYTEALPIDLNGDSQIGQNEVRDLAFVGGIGGVVIVDVTNPGAVAVLGEVPMNAEIFSIDFDAEKRKLFAGGRIPILNGDYTVFIIDLSGPNPFTPVDTDSNPQDDRIVWQSAPGTYAAGMMSHRAVRFDADTRTLYIGNDRGYDTLRLDPNVTGTATYKFYRPFRNGLDYANGIDLPIRGAVVELRRPGSKAVVLTTNTDEGGFYTFFGAPVGEPLEVFVRAILGSTGKPTATVVDNTKANKIYEQSSGVFTLGPTGKQTHNVYAKTGWDPVAKRYGVRDGAPFAILDDVFQAHKALRSIDPKIEFSPAVTMAWSVMNSPSGSTLAKAKGLLGSGAHFVSENNTVFLSGKENNDTDEYDAQVVLHEWSHYFMARFSRDDTIAGTHGFAYFLDPRVSFSEGFATAFAAMITNDPIYADTGGRAQSHSFAFSLERDRNSFSSFYSEDAVQELLWDLFDGTGTEIDRETGHDGPFFDSVQLGIKPIYDAMTTAVKTTTGFTTIFPFLVDLMAPFQADPLLKSTGDGIIALAHGENLFPDHADQFDQSTRMIIPFPIEGIEPIKIGRLYTPLNINGSTVLTFGPETPYDGEPLETNTRWDSDPAEGSGNRYEELVFFKFDAPKGDPPNVDVRHDYIVSVAPSAPGALWSLSVNEGAPKYRIKSTIDSESPDVRVCLVPGTHVAAVRAFRIVGDKRVPLIRQFSMQVKPAVVINGKPAGTCTETP
jgi:hypothetical protein